MAHKHLSDEHIAAAREVAKSGDSALALALLPDLLNEIEALRGKLKWAYKRCEPLYYANSQTLSSLQAKLHEHKLAYVGLQRLQAEVATEKAIYKTAIKELLVHLTEYGCCEELKVMADQALKAGELHREKAAGK